MATQDRNYTLNDAEKLLGTYSTLVRRLIELNAIPTRRIGKAIVLDQPGFDDLRAALTRWRNRPRMTKRPMPRRLQHISE